MHGLSPTDPGKKIDWGKTSGDYSAYRPGPPLRFYETLKVHEVGIKGQRMLDLGTGTGVLARAIRTSGADACGIDISGQQIETAQKLASEEGLSVDFKSGSAERIVYPDNSFDVVTANQCWLYFDATKAIPEVLRVLKTGGLLVTSHFSWLPRLDPIANATEKLILKHNPAWTANDFSGEIPNTLAWAEEFFDVRAMMFFDEDVSFTHESWCGRIRACRGVGASLSSDEVQQFNSEHMELLKNLTPDHFTVRHRIDFHILKPKPAQA